MRPRLLDLFCGAGGATKGYQRAGFYVVGVDLAPQPNYCGDEFIQADATMFHLGGFDAIHASPPCQAYTRARKLQGNTHPDLVAAVRQGLQETGVPWVIENVPGAPLLNPTMLCGLMFGLNVYRHRLFESSVALPLILHPAHHERPVKMGRPVKQGDIVQVVGHFSNVPYGREAMGIPWMTQGELAEAIPPAYTEWVGAHPPASHEGGSVSRTEKLSAIQVARCKRAWRDAVPIKDISAELNISKATLYRYAEVYDFGPHPNRDHKYQPRTAEPRPVPTMFRCEFCGGRSSSPCHESCGSRISVRAA